MIWSIIRRKVVSAMVNGNGVGQVRSFGYCAPLGSHDKTKETGCNTIERLSKYICTADHIDQLNEASGAISAFQHQPVVNAVVDGDDIIYRDYVDISIAVGTPKGLVVPVLRGAEKMNFAEIEKSISALARKLLLVPFQLMRWLELHSQFRMVVFMESLISTPIINPPQSAYLRCIKDVVEDPRKLLLDV